MSDIPKDFINVIEALNNNIKQAEIIEKETEINDANKLNTAIKEYVKVSASLTSLLKKTGKSEKLSTTIDVISNILKDKIAQELDEEREKLQEITNKVITDMVEDLKKKYKDEIDKTESLAENRVKIYEGISKQIDEIKRQLLDTVYIKKAFTLYDSDQIDAQINSLRVYFASKK